MKEHMSEAEYSRADKELFDMMAGKKPTGKKTVGVVISTKRAKQLDLLEEILFQFCDLVPVVEWTAATLLFATATVLGWMTLVFGGSVSAFTFAVAAFRFWRLRHGRE